jgi:hypothetical protein
VVGLAEVDELEGEATVRHDVAGLEVEVRDLVLLEVAQRLPDHEHEVDLGVERERGAALLDVLAEVGVVDEVHQQVVLVGLVLLRQQVVLRQEHADPVLDALQDEGLVPHPALPARLRPLIVLPLDDDALPQQRLLLHLKVVEQSHAVRAHVPVLDLGQVDGREAARLDLPELGLGELLADLDVVEHEVVLVGDAALLAQRQLQSSLQMLPLEKIQGLLPGLPQAALPFEVEIGEDGEAGETLANLYPILLQPAVGLGLLLQV